MTYPVVASGTSTTTAVDSDPAVSITLPTGTSAGDLLLVFVATDGAAALTQSGATWTVVASQVNGTATRHAIYGRVATGTDTISLLGANNADMAAVSIRVTGHSVTTVATDIKVGTASTGTTAAPDPPTATGLTAAMQYLTIASFGADDDDDTANYEVSGYTKVAQLKSATGTASCLVALCSTNTTGVTSLDPGVMAMAATEEWVASTILIPGTSGTTVTAGASAVTVTASNAVPRVTVAAGTASVTVTASNPAATATVTAGASAVTVTASNAAALMLVLTVDRISGDIVYVDDLTTTLSVDAISNEVSAAAGRDRTAHAGASAVTVAASNAAPRVTVAAGTASVTVTAHAAAPRVTVAAGTSAVTAAASNPAPRVTVAAGTTTVTVTASNAAPVVTVAPSSISVTVTAHDATATVAGGDVTAFAETTTVTVAAYAPAPTVTVAAPSSTVTVTALNPAPTVTVSAGTVTVTVTAADVAPTVTVAAPSSTVTVTAYAPTPAVTVAPSAATVTVAAYAPTWFVTFAGDTQLTAITLAARCDTHGLASRDVELGVAARCDAAGIGDRDRPLHLTVADTHERIDA